MQIRSKAGVRTVKLDSFERRTLTNAAVICGELGNLAAPEAKSVAAKAAELITTLLTMVTEPEVVE